MQQPLPTFVIALLIGACSAAMPRHEVLLWPEHLAAGVSPGDRVEVVANNGRRSVVRVAAVEGDTLVSDAGDRYTLTELEGLYLLSLAAPRNPCDTAAPLACSTPRVVTLLSDFHAEYRETFRAACATHDLCYRHGSATYGFEREACDARFLAQMRSTCGEPLALDLVERLRCEAAAAQFHEAVRRYGERRFLSDGSVCEYLGPAQAVSAPAPD